MKTPPARSRAFTLLELLVVIGIILLLAGFVFPVIARMQASGKSTACMANLRQIAAAFNLYRGENQGAFPQSADQSGGNYFTWYQTLLGQSVSAKWDNTTRSFVDGSGGINYLGSRDILNCPEGKFGTMGVSPGSPVGYGMASLTLWHPTVQRTDLVARTFYSTQLLRADEWPLVMCADHQRVWELNNPTAKSPATERFAPRHNGYANVLMVDGHIVRVKYGDTRWSQQVINKNNYYIP